MLIPLQGDIRSDYRGFSQLLQLTTKTKQCFFDDIEIDMDSISWIDANMCAPLGAILYKISRDLNNVTINRVSSPIEQILSKNGFLSNYGRKAIKDTYKTTVEYKRFEPEDDRYFAEYVEKNLVGKGIPRMSPGLLKKFKESIFEIFSNAVIHSETKLGIFSCGQYFPRKHRFDFSIADLGIGIRDKLSRDVGLELSASRAIVWALEGKNTTKKGPIPGGLGLKLLREFVQMNQGRIQIVSDCGYWEEAQGKDNISELKIPFPGTVVNVEINTADTSSYCLASEVNMDDIF